VNEGLGLTDEHDSMIVVGVVGRVVCVVLRPYAKCAYPISLAMIAYSW